VVLYNTFMKNKILKLLKTKNVFLTGGAGVGKSYLTKEIILEYKKNLKHVAVLGSTGISAINIGGQTIHSFFAFGICSNLEELVLQDRKNKKRIKEINELLKSCDLIIVDEISMVSCDMLDMIRYRVERAGSETTFLFVGDFFQLPPVVKNRYTNNLFGGIYAFESNSWSFFDPVVIELKEMKRTKDKEFFRILNKIRVGIVDNEVEHYLINLSNNTKVLKEEPTFLHGINKEVTLINEKNLKAHKAKEMILKSDITLYEKKLSNKRVQNWINSLPVNEELRIKEGVPVLFTSNKWGKFYNGERGVVKEIFEDSLIIEKNKRVVKVQRQEFNLVEYSKNSNEELEENILATLKQYPVKLAYAITIHKSQGMSIENLVCNIDHIFTPSQFYVAIGRAVNPKKLYIEYTRGNIKNYLKNIIKVNDSVKKYYNILFDI